MLSKKSLEILSRVRKQPFYPEYIGKNEHFLFSQNSKDFIIVENRESIYLVIRFSEKNSDYTTYNFSDYLEHKCNYWVRDRNDIEEKLFVKVFDILLQSDIIKYKDKEIHVFPKNIKSFREDSIRQFGLLADESPLAESVFEINKKNKNKRDSYATKSNNKKIL